MTLMLASVADVVEAEIALVEGADIIDLKDPSQGPLGALPLASVREIGGIIGKKIYHGDCRQQKKSHQTSLEKLGQEAAGHGVFSSP